MRHFLLIVLASTLTLSGCLNPSDPISNDHDVKIIIEDEDNPGVPYTQRLWPLAPKLRPVHLPDSADVTKLVVTLSAYGVADVTVDGKPWKSKNPLDFTAPKTFRLTSPNGKDHSFKLEVELDPYRLSEYSALFGEINWYGSRNDPLDPSLVSTVAPLSFRFASGQEFWSTWGTPFEVRFDGVKLNDVRGVLAVDLAVPHTVTIVNRAGNVVDWPVRALTWKPLTPTKLAVSQADNPTLPKDYVAEIDADTKTATLDLPSNLNLTSLKVAVEHNGLTASVGGVPTLDKPVSVDLSSDQTIHLTGTLGIEQDWTLVATRRPPMATNDLSTLTLYHSQGLRFPFHPSASNKIEGNDADPSYHTIAWTSSSVGLFLAASVYVELETSGSFVTAQGHKLAQGKLADGVYSANNWLNLNSPVVLTITAENGATQEFTVSLGSPK